jgi:hypothetical protein
MKQISTHHLNGREVLDCASPLALWKKYHHGQEWWRATALQGAGALAVEVFQANS